MLLRRIGRLEPGMYIRLKMWEDAEAVNYGIVEVYSYTEHCGRRIVRLYKAEAEDTRVFSLSFFPDDLVEMII